MPTRDTGAAQFVDQHPTWDGRGVTVGIVDLGVDLDHPSLNTTSTGQRKIVDWVTYTHPLTDGDPTWRFFTGDADDDRRWHLLRVRWTYTGFPIDGTYRFARMREDLLGATSEYGIACRRHRVRPRPKRRVRRLLRDGLAPVRQHGLDGRRQRCELRRRVARMTDVQGQPRRRLLRSRQSGDRGPRIGSVHRPAADRPGRRLLFWVNIGIVAGAHGSHVAGITAGNSLFGGQMSGAAPGAKIVSVRACLFVAGCTTHALIEGMIYVVETADVDVVNMSIGGLPALNDGNNTRAVLYNRLIEDNNTQMFISAGNSGPGENTIGDPAVATKVMAVGAYITGRPGRGTTAPTPTSWTTSIRSARVVRRRTARSSRRSWRPARRSRASRPGRWVSRWSARTRCRPGYGMFNGTSMAAPQSAGAAALLLSAAKARGFTRSAAQLRNAFNSTARFIPGYNAADQGNGLIDVNRAWDLYKDGPEPVNITSRSRCTRS